MFELIQSRTFYIGSVRALDFNKFQSNLLASGATESEVLLWDLNNPTNAMAPGSKSMVSRTLSTARADNSFLYFVVYVDQIKRK